MDIELQNGEERSGLTISTGISELDKKLGGGIPLSSTALIEGPNDSGKSVILQQFLYGSLYNKLDCVYFTTESTTRDFLSQMASLNTNILDFYIFGYVKIFTTNIEGVKWDADTSSRFLNIITDYIKNSEAEVFFIDSLTVFVTHATDTEVLDFFTKIKSITKKQKTVMISVHPHAFSEDLLTRIISICDVHLTLKIKNMGTKLAHMVEVSKIRGASETTGNIVGFQIEPGMGLRPVPITEVKL